MDGYGVARQMGVTDIDVTRVGDAGLRAMLTQAQDAGLLDVGMDEDLKRFEATRTGVAAVDASTALARTAVQKLRGISRAVEATNRISASVAAYNMAKQAGRSDKEAAAYAISVLQDTQGDFSRTDAPLLLKRLPKFMVQYRKFQFMMMAHYAKAFRDAFMSEDAQTRAVGRRALFWSLGHAGMAAGVLGLPLMNVAAILFAGIAGDDDEPADLEASLREWVGDEDMANVLMHGPLWFMGMDAKLAQDNIFSITPYTEWEMSKEGVQKGIVGAMGPWASVAQRFADGVDRMSRGDFYRGLENMLPSGFANLARAFRLNNKGYTLKNGDVLVKPEDLSGINTAWAAVGMRPPDVRRLDWYRSQQWRVTEFYKQRTAEIRRAYFEAEREHDVQAMAEAREDWTALQNGKDNWRWLFGNSESALKKQPLSNLLRAGKDATRRESKARQSLPGL
jgi:hypothetical protein